MIYLIIDVYYCEAKKNKQAQQTRATVAGIRFSNIQKNKILSLHQVAVDSVVPYEPGQFYKREMPCILQLLEQIDEPFDTIIIDGYVFLDGVQQAGLGKYLYNNLVTKKPIIGIAKNKFHTISEDFAVYRGISKRPLYVTSIGCDNQHAMTVVKELEGRYRLPRMITEVDQLSRSL